jgi:hypothetical protein
MYPFRTRLRISAVGIGKKSLQIAVSRRADSNRGPLHYEGRTSEGRASTRGHARACSHWKLASSSTHAVDARARSFPSWRTRFVPARHHGLSLG